MAKSNAGQGAADWTALGTLSPDQLHPFPLFASYWICPTPYRIPLVTFTGIQTMLMIEGRFRVRSFDPSGGRLEAEIGPGMVFSFFPGQLQYESVGAGPVRWYQTMFWPAGAPQPGETGRSAIPFVTGAGLLPHAVQLTTQTAAVAAIYERLIAALHFRPPTWGLECQAALLELLQAIWQAGARPAGEGSDRTADPVAAISARALKAGRWDALLTRLEQSATGAVPSVRALARESGMSVNHFIRQFRQHVGTTPKQYVLTRRLARARELLRQGALVKSAARQCGFDDPLYFSRQYRKLFGVAPSQAALQATADAGTLDGPQAAAGLPIGRHLWAPGFGIEWVRLEPYSERP